MEESSSTGSQTPELERFQGEQDHGAPRRWEQISSRFCFCNSFRCRSGSMFSTVLQTSQVQSSSRLRELNFPCYVALCNPELNNDFITIRLDLSLLTPIAFTICFKCPLSIILSQIQLSKHSCFLSLPLSLSFSLSLSLTLSPFFFIFNLKKTIIKQLKL